MAHSNENTNGAAINSGASGELRVTVLSASNLPRLSFFHEHSKAFVILRIQDQMWSTNVAERSKSPRWEKEFDLRGSDSTVLKIELKVSRQFAGVSSEQLVGAVEVRFEELRDRQRCAREENRDHVTLNLQVPFSSEPHPSICMRVHKGSVAPKAALDTARALVSGARDNVQDMKMGPVLPAVPTDASDAGTSSQDAIKTIGSAKEVKAVYETALASVETFVKLVDAFADIHPYVKAAWTAISAGYKIAMAQKDRDDALAELLESMTTALDLVCRFDRTALHKDDKDVILQVAKKTNECALFIQEYTRIKSFALRAAKGTFCNFGDEIDRFKKDFDILRRNVDTGAILSLAEGLSKINGDLYDIEESIKLIGENVDRVAQTTIIDKLPYAEGATWDPDRVCLSKTREALLEEIWQWIKCSDTSDGAKIFCLTGVAGSGKSAIAHTVAHRCYQEGLLASSFFFSRDVADRNNPRKLLSTMARDLSARDPRIREQISLAMESDQSLATAPLSRQFEPLIQKPCLRYPSEQPMVSVIDGLDEGYSVDLLKLFRDGIPKLPPSFRLFITSRDMEAIDRYLSKSTHVHLRTIDLGALANLEDVRVFIERGFKDIAIVHDLGESWPGQELLDKVFQMAGGLFQWVSVVHQSLELSYNPAAELATLLGSLRTGLAAQEKMDEIYTKILQACEWNSPDFKRDYDLVMGAILAAKSPLSVSALQALHPEIPNIPKLLSRLGALLTGWRYSNQPIRILHLSLRDFLTTRVSTDAPFYICEKDNSRRLGLVSLAFLNDNLDHNTPGVGYLKSVSPGIPTVSKEQISEELWYACEFWTAHILEFDAPAPIELAEFIRNFLSDRLSSWMELCTSVNSFHGFQNVRTWIQRTLPEDVDLMNDEFNSRLGSALVDMSERLSYMDRREEALLAIQEAVELRRQPIAGMPSSFKNDLASCLHDLSSRLSDVGRREDAVLAIHEAIELRRELAHHDPATFNASLASSLNKASLRLSDIGNREGALDASREALSLYRQLAEGNPVVFNPNLADSLDSFSRHLSALGHLEDALTANRESVVLYRQLANDNPTAFNPELARALGNLFPRQLDLGDALESIQESVELYRQLANDRPATFKPELARALSNLCASLSALHRHENALTVIQESVALYRQLTCDRPAVFNSNLAHSIHNLSVQLSALGRPKDTLAANWESLVLFRQLAQGCPAAFNHHLAGSLLYHSKYHSALGNRGEALAAAKEAVELYRPLASDVPAVFKSMLVESLKRLSSSLRALGHKDDALAAAMEAKSLDSPETLLSAATTSHTPKIRRSFTFST
ncbi:hypothetical protein BOTBODRAFT_38985 [Botryobasidium botryosum FD-172 SS1]|uniref:C2 domain-containing protein n=1 Tax=Botryobasidium botryosum (strain FD-172 SS1) TaxID=930990 RepID=A0A067M5T8_BOTB1|nr:hypothetical protein BOTBODRAFT_38985 [Botryobasidium botryosum FD-172 SS1]